jgi:hypothetical protein
MPALRMPWGHVKVDGVGKDVYAPDDHRFGILQAGWREVADVDMANAVQSLQRRHPCQDTLQKVDATLCQEAS